MLVRGRALCQSKLIKTKGSELPLIGPSTGDADIGDKVCHHFMLVL